MMQPNARLSVTQPFRHEIIPSQVREIIDGLARRPASLPCSLFYDKRGSRLFERITELPEYYPTRTEMSILADSAADIAAIIGPRAVVIEPGAGDQRKMRLLVNSLDTPAVYVPIDISREQLGEVSSQLAREHPAIEVLPLCADFTRTVGVPRTTRPHGRKVVFFPGSTIGNFETEDARRFLSRLGRIVERDGLLVVGVDLVKDRATLEAAYDDSAGVTAEFNRNVLARLAREHGAKIDLGAWRHRSFWNEPAHRVEMHLVSTREQTIRIRGRAYPFADGAHIVTEHCYKYSVPSFTELANRAGLTVERVLTDPRRWFAVFVLRQEAGSVTLG
jgi:dimethylhistidine N-methyltransferase